jgi:hypothetical protein
MAMKLKRTNRQAQQMRRRTLLIAAAGSILGLIIALVVIFNFSYIKNIFAAGSTYYSRANGNWESATTWSKSGYGGTAASDFPKAGDIVYISGNTVTVNSTTAAAQEVRMVDGNTTSQLTINAGKKLAVSGNYYMTMAPAAKNIITTLVTGTGAELTVGGDLLMSQENGKQQLQVSANLGGKITIAGNLTATDKNGGENTKISISDNSQLLVGKNLTLTSDGGTGIVYITLSQTAEFSIAGNIYLNSKSANSVAVKATDNSVIYLGGSIIQTGTTNGSVVTTGGAKLVLGAKTTTTQTGGSTGTGSTTGGTTETGGTTQTPTTAAPQTMDGSDAGADSLVLNDLTIDKGVGAQVILATNIYITGSLNLISGTLVTKPGAVITLGPNAVVTGGSANSFVSGPIRKVGTSAFTFPVGKGTTYAPISVSASATSTTYSAEYFNQKYAGSTTLSGGLGSVSLKEYWNLQRVSGTGTPKVTLSWENSTNSGISTATGLQVARLDTITKVWSPVGGVGTVTGSVPGAGSVTSPTAATSFGVMTLAGTTPTALPVTLLYFKAAPSGGTVNLTWATSMEINNDHFEIERSKDAKTFEKIGTVNGAGNSKVQKEYSYTDRDIQKGVVYYRLRQVDLNGEFEVFPMQVVKMNTAEIKTVAPNPFRDKFEMQYELASNSSVTIEIYKVSGQKVYTENVSGNAGINVYRYANGTNLAPGTYILYLVTDGQRISTKIIKS